MVIFAIDTSTCFKPVVFTSRARTLLSRARILYARIVNAGIRGVRVWNSRFSRSSLDLFRECSDVSSARGRVLFMRSEIFVSLVR